MYIDTYIVGDEHLCQNTQTLDPNTKITEETDNSICPSPESDR